MQHISTQTAVVNDVTSSTLLCTTRGCQFRPVHLNIWQQTHTISAVSRLVSRLVFRPYWNKNFSKHVASSSGMSTHPGKPSSLWIFSQACSKHWYVNRPWKTLFSVLILSIAAETVMLHVRTLHPYILNSSVWVTITDFSIAERMCDIGMSMTMTFCVPSVTSETITTTVNKTNQ